MDVTLIIPVYNEEKAIVKLINDAVKLFKKKKYKYEIIVVDDASTDSTCLKIENMKIKLIQHQINKGVGAARKTGILAAKYNNLVMIDGDGTYPINKIPDLLNGLKDYDMIVGARTSEKGTFKFIRTIIKNLIRKLAEFISDSKIVDLNSGLRAFKKDHIIRFFNILPNTHSWVSTQTICYLSNYYSVKYLPIPYYKRLGKSTFHPLKDTYNYVSLIFRTIMYFNPLKIFFPLSLIVMVYGVFMGLYHGFKGEIIRSDIIIIIIGGFISILGLLADIIIKSTKSQYYNWIK